METVSSDAKELFVFDIKSKDGKILNYTLVKHN